MEKYTQGFDMRSLKNIPEISFYNYNYYVGLDKDLILGISDNDNLTEWYICKNESFIQFGHSFYCLGDKLELGKLT